MVCRLHFNGGRRDGIPRGHLTTPYAGGDEAESYSLATKKRGFFVAQAAPRGMSIPHSEMTEQALIASILLDEDQAWAEGVDGIAHPADFFTPEHRATYAMMIALHKRGERVTIPAVVSEMARQKVIDRVDEITGGAESYLIERAGITWMFSARGCGAWARQIAEYSARRKALSSAQHVVKNALDLSATVDASLPIYDRDEYRGAAI